MTNRTPDQPGPNMYAMGTYAARRVYDFKCPACGASGKIVVPVAYRTFDCPNNSMSNGLGQCPAKFIQWQPPEAQKRGSWAMRCINVTDAKTAIDIRSINRKTAAMGINVESSLVADVTKPREPLILPFKRKQT